MPEFEFITESTIERRRYWTKEIIQLSGSFGTDTAKLQEELRAEIATDGVGALVDHLRLCGAIPEWYGHDSSEEKLYSKYTDCVLNETFLALGLKSVVLSSRGDSADVEAVIDDYSLVADAKAFRLSRTAKNQKDFKVQAMDGWRGTMSHALVVCPVYQLPTRSSQIYAQAIARNVTILSYSHLSALVAISAVAGHELGHRGLRLLLDSVAFMNPSKDAGSYWTAINEQLRIALGDKASEIWRCEKMASLESLGFGQVEAIQYLQSERKRLMSLSHADAITELIRSAGVDERIQYILKLSHGTLLEV